MQWYQALNNKPWQINLPLVCDNHFHTYSTVTLKVFYTNFYYLTISVSIASIQNTQQHFTSATGFAGCLFPFTSPTGSFCWYKDPEFISAAFTRNSILTFGLRELIFQKETRKTHHICPKCYTENRLWDPYLYQSQLKPLAGSKPKPTALCEGNIRDLTCTSFAELT